MPFILVIIGVIATLGIGGYFWEANRNDALASTPAPVVTEVTPPATDTPSTSPTEPTPNPSDTPVTTPPNPTPTPVTTPIPTPVLPKTVYKNGSYTADVSYNAPDGMSHGVTVALTLANDIVTASNVVFASSFGATANYQSRFAAEYKSQVVGQSLANIALSRVGGASLTTGAWNKAQAQIEAEAQS